MQRAVLHASVINIDKACVDRLYARCSDNCCCLLHLTPLYMCRLRMEALAQFVPPVFFLRVLLRFSGTERYLVALDSTGVFFFLSKKSDYTCSLT